jgi:hypothetical protein
MSHSWKVTLVASLIGTGAGTCFAAFKIGDHIWPAHGSLVAFLVTLATSIAVLILWPKESLKQP